MNRRDLIQRVMVGGAVLVLVPSVLQSCTKATDPDPINDQGNNTGGGNTTGTKINIDLTLAENAVLNTAGGSKVVQNILIINIGGGYSALSSVCTHAGCTLGYSSSAGRVECPCHGSAFSTSGSVINGPATSSLQTFAANKSGNVLTVTI